jgi:hypothetical protein
MRLVFPLAPWPCSCQAAVSTTPCIVCPQRHLATNNLPVSDQKKPAKKSPRNWQTQKPTTPSVSRCFSHSALSPETPLPCQHRQRAECEGGKKKHKPTATYPTSLLPCRTLLRTPLTTTVLLQKRANFFRVSFKRTHQAAVGRLPAVQGLSRVPCSGAMVWLAAEAAELWSSRVACGCRYFYTDFSHCSVIR